MNHIRNQYLEYQKKTAHIAHIQALLARDQEAVMPSKAGAGRAEQVGYMSTIHHHALSDPEYATLIEQLLIDAEKLEPRQQRSVYLAAKEVQHNKRLDVKFVERFETVKSRSQQVWYEARKKNDFQLFAPHLEEVVTMCREYARQIEPSNDPYDTLLDIYEEGATQEWYDACLLPLQPLLTDLLHTIPANNLSSSGADRFTKDETKKLVYELSKNVGFDMDAGVLGEVHHPFMTTLGGYDYRINTRYDHPIEAIMGMIHELGHGLYEQRIDPKFFYTNLHYGASTGMHESQSRTLENIIGRSRGMSEYLDSLSKKYGKQYTGTAKAWYEICNNVKPSLIRIEADEVSYGLHILLRYELEKEILGGSLSVRDLPDAWNEKMQQYLGITPPTDTVGCLQDVHRSCGLFGYFPTYLLGNVYGAQVRKSFEEAHPHRERDVAQGNFQSYFSWHKDHVWSYGCSLHPQEILKKITGRDVDATHFIDYLTTKYT